MLIIDLWAITTGPVQGSRLTSSGFKILNSCDVFLTNQKLHIQCKIVVGIIYYINNKRLSQEFLGRKAINLQNIILIKILSTIILFFKEVNKFVCVMHFISTSQKYEHLVDSLSRKHHLFIRKIRFNPHPTKFLKQCIICTIN